MTEKTRQYVYAKADTTLDIRTISNDANECMNKAAALKLTGGFARGLLLRKFTEEELDARRPMLLPPPAYLGYAYVHWVEGSLFGSGLELWQWQPAAQIWCRPNEYSSGRDHSLAGYKWAGLCPPPPLSDEYESAADLLRRKVDEAVVDIDTPRAVTLTAEEIRELSTIFFDSMSRPVKTSE